MGAIVYATRCTSSCPTACTQSHENDFGYRTPTATYNNTAVSDLPRPSRPRRRPQRPNIAALALTAPAPGPVAVPVVPRPPPPTQRWPVAARHYRARGR